MPFAATFATTGVLTLKNAGEHSACQFRVDIEGLPADCFQIDPIPLMYSGAQEEVRIRIFHRILYPPAGLQTIVLKISAPESYSGEELIIRQDIYVTPVFSRRSSFLTIYTLRQNGKSKPRLSIPL
jgi:hypothetical protein